MKIKSLGLLLLATLAFIDCAKAGIVEIKNHPKVGEFFPYAEFVDIHNQQVTVSDAHKTPQQVPNGTYKKILFNISYWNTEKTLTARCFLNSRTPLQVTDDTHLQIILDYIPEVLGPNPPYKPATLSCKVATRRPNN